MIRSLVSGGHNMTRIREDLEGLGMSSDVVANAIADYEQQTNRIRTLKRPMSVRKPGLVDWYPGPQDDDRFWPPLRRLLEDKGWSDDVVQSVDDASSKVLSHMQPPGVGTFSTKGLVLGYVQSGKTTNFTGLISKAADVGYKFFIVLSGVHNKLRAQTQERLFDELVALNTEHWISVTQPDSDFRISGVGNVDAFLTANYDHKVLGVVKKNMTVLTRLRDWLRGASETVLAACPILIIDDEADQASINTTGDAERRSRINGLLLELLASGTKVSYVGYTATPFANIFVDPTIGDDIYPSDFIVDLPRPENYFGTETLFGREPIDADDHDPAIHGTDMIRSVPMEELAGLRPSSRDGRFDFKPVIEPSLRDALNYFWMATAARRSRGDEGHSSMLVHTTLYVDAHLRFQKTIEEYRDSVLSNLENSDPVLIEDLEMLWEQESHAVQLPKDNPRWTSFATLRPFLEDTLRATLVPVENNQSLARLSYEEDGSTQIVVGGNVLSRGLTLEGLTVSYFIRTSTAYDTLLQMGRWFGYRVGYEELPRVWMTDELQRYFHDLATVEFEIRSDVARYEREEITPIDFAVRVRTHPKMSITARSKMSAARELEVSYSGQRPQTILFKNEDQAWLKRNQLAAKRLVSAATDQTDGFVNNFDTYRVARGVGVATILQFLRGYEVHPEAADVRTAEMSAYIVDQNAEGDLLDWNVVIATQLSGERTGTFDFGSGVTVPKVERTSLKRISGDGYVSIGTLLVKLDYVADLDLDTPKRELARLDKVDLMALRPKGNVGSLILYPIAKDSRPANENRKNSRREALNAVDDMIGIGIVFPDANRAIAKSYMSVDLSHISREIDEHPEEDESDGR